MEENNNIEVIKKKRTSSGPKKKRKKKGMWATVERFFESLADASDAEAYEKEVAAMYSKKKK
jgi:hypothetical protein